MSEKHLQSVLFPKDKFTIKQAEQWLEKHDLAHYKVDITKNKLRFRQEEPIKNAIYETHTLPNDVQLVLQYEPTFKKSDNVEIKIVKSDDNKHKYMAIVKDNKEIKHVKFGAIKQNGEPYEDYTTHHNKEKMQNYTQRHIKEKKFWDYTKDNIYRPSFYAKHILWNDQTSNIKKAIQLTSKALGINITLDV